MSANTQLVNRLASLTFRNLLALAIEAKGSALGFDPNRGPGNTWQGGNLKPKLATWMEDNLSVATIQDLLPKYEKKSANARRWVATAKATGVQSVKRPGTFTGTGEDEEGEAGESFVPMHYPADEQAAGMAQQMTAQAMPTASPTAGNASKSGAADEGTTVTRVREIAREEAGKLDEVIKAWVSNAEQLAADTAQRVAELERARPIMVTVSNGTETSTTTLPRQHRDFERLLKRCALRDHKGNAYNIWLTGPAGSGKTTAAENAAAALSLPFHFSGAIDNEFKLLGFIDASGRCIRTAFREAYEHGGIFLLDEVDGCHAGALLALNAALANGYCDFPDTKVKRHKDCVILAAANTWGTGATHDYIGRNKLDAASLDRFIMLEWAYDEELERDTCGNVEWCHTVQVLRRKVIKAGIKHVISPRASYVGAAMLAAGISRQEVMAEVVYKGLTAAQIQQIDGRGL